MNYVKSEFKNEEMAGIAEKARRMKSWFDKARSAHGGDPGAGAGFAALHLLFFPITYPSYLLFNKPDILRWCHKAFWPFYEVTLNISTRGGEKEFKMWVEGTAEGLCLARNRWGKGIWTQWNIPWSMEPIDHPLVVNPKKNLGVKEVIKGNPEDKDAIQLPYTFNAKEAANYLKKAGEDAINGEKVEFNAVQFGVACLADGFEATAMDSFRIENVAEVSYPFWIAKYEKKDSRRLTAFAGTRKARFDRVEIANTINKNGAFRNRLPKD